MPVWRMRLEIPNDEYVHWSVYYARKAQRTELARLKAG